VVIIKVSETFYICSVVTGTKTYIQYFTDSYYVKRQQNWPTG